MVAAREQHFKDPPMPKVKSAYKNSKGENVDESNPLWLKDKGDEF